MTDPSSDYLYDIAVYYDLNLADIKAPKARDELFRQWIHDALMLWIRTSEAGSFAPFDDRFRNRLEPADNFRSFIEDELGGLGRIGRHTASSIVAAVLRAALADLDNPNSPFLVNVNGVPRASLAVLDVFHALRAVDRVSAVEWFGSYLAAWRADQNHQRDAREVALPLVLFDTLDEVFPTDPLGAEIAHAMFDWCVLNASEKDIWKAVPRVLTLRLTAITRGMQSQSARQNKALAVLEDFAGLRSERVTLDEILSAAYSMMPDGPRRWYRLREEFKKSIVGISLENAEAPWLREAKTPLFYNAPWVREDLAKGEGAAKGMLKNIFDGALSLFGCNIREKFWRSNWNT